MACSPLADPDDSAGQGETVDSTGKTVTAPRAPDRLISLAPSATELLVLLNAGELLVGVDDYSPLEGLSGEVARVGTFPPDYELIASLDPDLIIGAFITPAEHVDRLESLGFPVFIADSRSVEGIPAALEALAGAVDREDAYAEIADSFNDRMAAIADASSTDGDAPTIYWEIDATDPARPFVAGPGSLANDVIRLAGGVNVFADLTDPYPQVSLEAVLARNPDLIVLGNAPWGESIATLGGRPGWASLRAISNRQVLELSESQADAASRATPAMLDLIEYMADSLSAAQVKSLPAAA